MIQTNSTGRHFTSRTALATAAAVLGFLAAASGCGSSDESKLTATTTATTAGPVGTENGETSVNDPSVAPEEQTLFVGPDLIDCEGAGPQTCLQVRRSPSAEWELFYDQIEGFSPEQGTSYELIIEVSNVEDPPADGSSLRYRLISVVSETLS